MLSRTGKVDMYAVWKLGLKTGCTGVHCLVNVKTDRMYPVWKLGKQALYTLSGN